MKTLRWSLHLVKMALEQSTIRPLGKSSTSLLTRKKDMHGQHKLFSFLCGTWVGLENVKSQIGHRFIAFTS